MGAQALHGIEGIEGHALEGENGRAPGAQAPFAELLQRHREAARLRITDDVGALGDPGAVDLHRDEPLLPPFAFAERNLERITPRGEPRAGGGRGPERRRVHGRGGGFAARGRSSGRRLRAGLRFLHGHGIHPCRRQGYDRSDKRVRSREQEVGDETARMIRLTGADAGRRCRVALDRSFGPVQRHPLLPLRERGRTASRLRGGAP